MKQLEIDELNRIYDNAEQADKDVFAEQRSNILLVAGDHYTKTSDRYRNLIRTNKDLSDSQKLRLTKNHTYRISHLWKNSILAYAPGVAIKPQRDNELQDKKDAELNNSVYQFYKYKYRLKEKYREFCSDFIDTGECCGEILFDPNAGEFLGYEQAVTEDGQPAYDEMGEMIPDEAKPVFKGAFVFNRIFAFNLLREASSNDMRKSKCWIVRDMSDTKELEIVYASDPEKLAIVKAGEGDDFVVFDAAKKGYDKVKNQTLLRRYYWPKCKEYPEGYFVIATSAGILEEGPLPGGVFPLVWGCFDQYQSSPRGRSIIKQIRPYQGEVNRASSQVALHQVSIGDDKILYQSGTKLAAGALLPGVRGLTYQGAAPEILPGRDGSQFLPYIQAQIAEMYQVAMVAEIEQELVNNLEPMTLLYRSASQQKKFKPFAEKFEQFLVDFVTTFLELAKFYIPDDELIPMIGRPDMVNVAEFRKTSELCYQIIVEAADDTIETKLGRQITFNNVMQYAGSNLSKEDIGQLMRHSPYGNAEGAFSDYTLNADTATNMILALERGEQPVPNKYDDGPYMIKRLTKRMREADFDFLAEEIRANYDALVQQYEQMEADKAAAIAAAKNEFIPVDGPLIACDLYVEDKEKPDQAPKRARVPERALSWLIEKIEEQGLTLSQLETMNQGALAEMAHMIMGQGQQQPQMLPPGGSGMQVAMG